MAARVTDKLKGGSGPNTLLGGDGSDLRVGGSNRDLLIGGLGADRMVGNPGDDIMIAGVTSFEGLVDPASFEGFNARQAALEAIMDEWTSTNDYDTRVANLSATLTDNVTDDGSKDVLTGSAGIDWFFANLEGDGVLDKITDLSADEFAQDLDFINLEV